MSKRVCRTCGKWFEGDVWDSNPVGDLVDECYPCQIAVQKKFEELYEKSRKANRDQWRKFLDGGHRN